MQEEPHQDEEKQLQDQQPQQSNATGGLLEEDILGLNLVSNGGLSETTIGAGALKRYTAGEKNVLESPFLFLTTVQSTFSCSNASLTGVAVPSIDDLLNNSSPIETSAMALITSTLPSSIQAASARADPRTTSFDSKEMKQNFSEMFQC